MEQRTYSGRNRVAVGNSSSTVLEQLARCILQSKYPRTRVQNANSSSQYRTAWALTLSLAHAPPPRPEASAYWRDADRSYDLTWGLLKTYQQRDILLRII